MSQRSPKVPLRVGTPKNKETTYPSTTPPYSTSSCAVQASEVSRMWVNAHMVHEVTCNSLPDQSWKKVNPVIQVGFNQLEDYTTLRNIMNDSIVQFPLYSPITVTRAISFQGLVVLTM